MKSFFREFLTEILFTLQDEIEFLYSSDSEREEFERIKRLEYKKTLLIEIYDNFFSGSTHYDMHSFMNELETMFPKTGV